MMPANGMHRMSTFEDRRTSGTVASVSAPEGGAAIDADPGTPLDDRIIAALREVYDPEIPVNIYDLGLIYRIDCDEMGVVEIDMTLTAPGCPVAQTFPGTVEAAVQNVEGVATAEVELVWEPPWTPDRMSEAAKLELGFSDSRRPDRPRMRTTREPSSPGACPTGTSTI